jgi:putative transposase
MPRRARLVLPGVAHHVTQRGNNRQQVFFSDEDRAAYLDRMFDYCALYSTKVLAYCGPAAGRENTIFDWRVGG